MKKCSFCKQEIPKDSERCPHCSTVCKSYFDIFYDIRIIATIIVVFALLGNMVEKGSIPVEFFSNALSYQKTIDDTESNYVDIDIRPPYNLSGLSRDEILYNRKKYFFLSLYNLTNYIPSFLLLLFSHLSLCYLFSISFQCFHNETSSFWIHM